MNQRENKQILIGKVCLYLMVGLLVWFLGVIYVSAACSYYLEIRFQGRVKSKDESDTENAVPQGMAGNGNTIYLLKWRKSTNSNVEDRSYIIKILNANTNSPKLVLPADAAYVGHGNGMVYYNGYLYVTGGDIGKPVLYRIWEEENSTKSWNPSTEWTDGNGTIHYEKKTMTLQGFNGGEEIRNIAHYQGDYFIVCLKSSYSGTTNTLTYGVGLLKGTTFTIQKRFTVEATDTYSAVQDIDYSDGYLWAVLYKSNDTKNNIHLIEIPTSYSAIENGATYPVKKTVGINKNEAGRSDTKNEVESIYINGSNYYTWSNIRTGWNETFCRYPRFPNGVTISSVATKSENSIVIKWNKVDNADNYRIDRRKEDGDYSTITTVDGSKDSYTDTGLTAGTKYYYRVYGVNSAGTSPKKYGEAGVTKTLIPKVNSVTAVSESELKIKWTAVPGAKKYIICRKRENSGEGWEYYTRIKEVTGTEFTDTGLEANTLYYYGIIAVNETGIESGGMNGNPGSDNRMSGRTLEAIKIALNRTSLYRVSGDTYKLEAAVSPSYAANSHVSWASSDSAVAIVDQEGKVTAIRPGIAVITATEQMKNKDAKCKITVYEPELILPNSLSEIKESSFEGTAAKIVYIKDDCIRIGAYAFRNSSVSQIRIPSNCVIEDGAFDLCENVTIYGTAGSDAQIYCTNHGNCSFVEE